MTITTKTADKLSRMAFELTAIADALDEAGHKVAADDVSAAAHRCALAASAVNANLANYAAAANKDTP